MKLKKVNQLKKVNSTKIKKEKKEEWKIIN